MLLLFAVCHLPSIVLRTNNHFYCFHVHITRRLARRTRPFWCSSLNFDFSLGPNVFLVYIVRLYLMYTAILQLSFVSLHLCYMLPVVVSTFYIGLYNQRLSLWHSMFLYPVFFPQHFVSSHTSSVFVRFCACFFFVCFPSASFLLWFIQWHGASFDFV